MKKKEGKGNRSKLGFLCWLLICGFLLSVLWSVAVNAYVKNTVKGYVLSTADAEDLQNVSCILVLGCRVRSDGAPGGMLADRLDVGISLYRDGVAPKLLMSGDHGGAEYDEVNAMKQYAIERGVTSSDVFMDHAGFSTYDSLYRAKEIFGAARIVIVTQGYHLYRALYIARSLGIEAYGVAADLHTYSGQGKRDFREFFARNKDFIGCAFGVKPKYLGESIPIDGNGNLTND